MGSCSFFSPLRMAQCEFSLSPPPLSSEQHFPNFFNGSEQGEIWWTAVDADGDGYGDGDGNGVTTESIRAARAPGIFDLGEELPKGRVKCRKCGKACASWLGLLTHLKRAHGKRIGETGWEDVQL
jgi:hypothetical protein